MGSHGEPRGTHDEDERGMGGEEEGGRVGGKEGGRTGCIQNENPHIDELCWKLFFG